MNSSESQGPDNRGQNVSSSVAKRPRLALLVVGGALLAGVWLFRAPLQETIRTGATLANDVPNSDAVSEMIEKAAEPRAALLAAWNSGKIVHREVAMASVARVFPNEVGLPPEIEAMVVAGALDPDANVRESALSLLRARNHPALVGLALDQTDDPDQRVRLLGLNQLRWSPPDHAIHRVAALLDDPDLSVVGLCLKLLERWSGQKFGSRLADTIEVENQTTGLREFQAEGTAKTRAAAAAAKAWWSAHASSFPKPVGNPTGSGPASLSKVIAPDFELKTLDGRTVRLSQLRGKVVLINFWTTWCTACVGEMPALVALQQRFGDQVAILGVSLDYVPDSHGHIGGHAEVEAMENSEGHHDDHEETVAALKRVREKVVRVAKKRGLNYPVLLDEQNDVGGRYNGGELPTTVLVDAEGYVRRRFVGARSLPVFEAMITEARQPLPTTGMTRRE